MTNLFVDSCSNKYVNTELKGLIYIRLCDNLRQKLSLHTYPNIEKNNDGTSHYCL